MKGWIFYTQKTEEITKKALKGIKLPEDSLRMVDSDEVSFIIDTDLRPQLWLGKDPIDPPDFVLTGISPTEYSFALLTQLELVGTICINPVSVIKTTRDKIATSQVLAKAGIPIAKTLPLNKNVTAEMLNAQFGFPLIVKPNSEYGGAGVELIRTSEEYDSYAREHKDDISAGKILAQEFISASKGKDLRVFMIGDNPVYSYIRKANDPDEFRSNISVGGAAVPFELTDELITLSKKITKALNTSIAGIDYLFTDSGVVVGEVNSVPGIAGFPDPKAAVKALFAYVAAQIMTRPFPAWKVDACLDAAKERPLSEKLMSLEKYELPAVQASLFNRCEEVQSVVLTEIIDRCKDTEFGRAHNFKDIHSIDDYRAKMPLTEWQDYEGYSKRLETGEADLLFPGRAEAFFATSGTSGTAKMVPESAEAQIGRKLITNARQLVLFKLMEKIGTGKVILFSNAPVSSVTSGGIPCGSASGQTVSILPPEAASLVAYPISLYKAYTGDELNYMLLRCTLTTGDIVGVAGNNAARLTAISEYAVKNAAQLVDDIRQGTCALPIPQEIQADVTPYLTANPERAEFLAELIKDNKFIPRYYWPRLQLACFWLGGSVGMYVKEAAAIMPENAMFFDVGYGSSEVKINIPTKPGTPAGVLATYCGFFEFIPEDGGEPLLAHQLEDGNRYELVVTTYAGLYRYRMHDIVQVEGFTGNTPNLYFITKLGDVGSIAQEKLYGSAFASCMHAALEKLGLTMIQAQAYTDTVNKRYIAYIELQEQTDIDLKSVEEKLEKELYDTNSAYHRARDGVLKPMALTVMKSGWKDYLYEKHCKGSTSITQVKLPVIISEQPSKEWVLK